MPLDKAARALGTYLETLELHGGDEKGLSEMIVTGAVGSRLQQHFSASWDVFVMGSEFSYSIHCARYVELAGNQWNVLLCQSRALDDQGEGEDEYEDDTGDDGDEDNGESGKDARQRNSLGSALAAGENPSSGCNAERVTRYSNGSLPTPSEPWHSLEVTFYQAADGHEDSDTGHAAAIIRLLSSLSPVSLGPEAAQIAQRKVADMWPHIQWNVLVEYSSLARTGHTRFAPWLCSAGGG